MAVVAIIAGDEKSRRDLRLAVEELGHKAAPAEDLKGGLETLRSERPRLMVVAQAPEEPTAESLLAELEREAPLIPVVVAMAGRNAARAMDLMKAGVFDVVASPWTPESLSACISKALRFKGTAFEVVRKREVSASVSYYLLSALIVLGLAVGLATLQKRRRLARLAEETPPPTSWALPYSHPAGLAYDGKEFWVTDWFSQSLHRHDPSDMRLKRTLHFPREVPGALAFGGDAVWIAAAPRSIVKHMLDEKLSVLGWFKDAAPQSVGLAYDGLYLWTADSRRGRLHKRILDEELSIAASYDYPGARPAALAFDGRDLWSLDAGNRELLRHDIAAPGRVTLKVPLPEYRSGKWKPMGLAFDGKRFWTVAERRPKGQSEARIFMHELPEKAGR